MGASERIRKSTHTPTLREFLECTHRHFGYLIDEFGFTEVPPPRSEDPNLGFVIRYLRAEVQITIRGENWGYAVQVLIEPARGTLTAGDWACPLWAILRLRCPDRIETLSVTRGQLPQLEVYGAALRECARDVLEGDFSVVPAALRIMWDEAARAEASELQRSFEQASLRAANAFWRKEYSTFVEILEPFRARLTPVQMRMLAYARSKR